MTHEFKQWQQQRYDALAAPDSWLGLVGLFWLEAGENRVGSAADALVLLANAPPHLGDLCWQGEKIIWRPVAGEAIELQTDRDGQPTIIDYQNWSFFVVDREHRLAVRLRDRNWSSKQHFAGLDYFDFDPAWQIDADWQALSPPLQMLVPNVSGEQKVVAVSHQAVFEVAGQTVRLLPMSVSDSEVSFIFRDRSSGNETYGAGRFLKTKVAVNGKITLDFNFAFNPPCAFTPFALCPLPPPENWLTFAIHAGEKKPPM